MKRIVAMSSQDVGELQEIVVWEPGGRYRQPRKKFLIPKSDFPAVVEYCEGEEAIYQEYRAEQRRIAEVKEGR